MSTLADRVIWITGATGALGNALAHALHAQGAHVVLSSRRIDDAEPVSYTHLTLPTSDLV